MNFFFNAVFFHVAGWRRDERGATAMEYGLIVALIAVALITVLFLIGGDITAQFTTASDTLNNGP